MATSQGTPLRQWIVARFVLLVAVMVAPLFALILITTESGFRGYVYQGDVHKAQAFAPLLESEFAKSGSWLAVEPLLARAPFSYHTGVHEAGADSQGTPSQDLDWLKERVVILDTHRNVVVDSKHVLVGTNHPAEHVADALVLRDAAGQTIGYLLVGTMVDPALTQNHRDFLTATALTLVVLLLVSLGLAVPLAYWLGSKITRPLGALVQGTQRAALGDWHWTLPPGSPREVQELDGAFQSLGRSLRTSEERKARLLADAAHELRTPLTVVRGTLEAMIDGVFPLDKARLQAVFAETVRLEAIVDSLRQLEDLHGQPFQPVAFRWCEPVRRVGDLFQAEARSKGLTLTVVCPEDLEGWGEADGIQQILVNLLSNALRYGRPNGRVNVEVRAVDGVLVLGVEDDGPGTVPEERNRVFERFVRLDPSRSGRTGGRGLGLAIVGQLVERHGGTVQIVDSALGGARFEVRLPLNTPNP